MCRKITTAIIITLLTVISLPAAPVKVVTWNLEWFPCGSIGAKPAEKKAHMKAAQEALKALNPDVLCLQEVQNWDAAEELVSVLPGFSVDVVSRFRGRQQQVVASRLPVDSAWSERWSSEEVADIPRGYAFAALKMPDGSFLLVYSLHMKANGRGDDEKNLAKREESSRQLIAHAIEMRKLYGERGKTGVILAGDWNTTLDDNPRFNSEMTIREALARGFHSTWEGVAFAERVTHPGSRKWPGITFDYMLTAGLGSPVARIAPFPGVSDHLPVMIDVDRVSNAPLVRAPSPTGIRAETAH